MENRRQKILLAMLLTLVVITIGWTVVKPVLLDPVDDDRDTVERLRSEHKRLTVLEAVTEPAATNRWKSLASQTLSLDPMKVKNILQREIPTIATKSGLTSPRFRPGSIRESRSLKGLAIVPMTVTAQGTLPTVTRFLGAVYELPFLVRLSRVQISRIGTGTRSTAKEVSLTATIESLAMPVGKENGAFVGSEKNITTFELPGNPNEMPTREPPVLAKAIAQYASMESKNPFHGADPPAPPPPQPRVAARPQTNTGNRFANRQTPRPTPSRNRGQDPAPNMILAGVLSYPPSQYVTEGRREIILRDKRTKSRTYLGLGDNLVLRDTQNQEHDLGTIILVHPYGVVTQHEAETRFYRVGQSLDQFETLDGTNNLDLWSPQQ